MKKQHLIEEILIHRHVAFSLTHLRDMLKEYQVTLPTITKYLKRELGENGYKIWKKEAFMRRKDTEKRILAFINKYGKPEFLGTSVCNILIGLKSEDYDDWDEDFDIWMLFVCSNVR